MIASIVTGVQHAAPFTGWTTRLARAATSTMTVTTIRDTIDGDTPPFERLVNNPDGEHVALHMVIPVAHTAQVAVKTITVTTTLDEMDGDVSSFERLIDEPGGKGISLREAITAANAMPLGPQLRIHFAIPDSDAGYETSTLTWRIRPDLFALPPLTRGDIVIDGTTQPGASLVSYPVIVLDGSEVYEGVSGLNGLTIASSGNVIRGLALVSFWDAGIVIEGAAAHDNVVAGCFIGIVTDDIDGDPNYYGIDIRDGAQTNLIGGSAAADRNIIGRNDFAGVRIDGSDTITNTIAGNWIGVDARGTGAAGNRYYGVVVSGRAHHNHIGRPGNGNVISGNDYGVMIWGANENRIVGNVIGLAPDRSTPMGNDQGGVFLVDGASRNMVGGETDGERNIISSNGYGVFVGQYYETTLRVARLNQVLGNYIGVDLTGILPRGNTREGIWLDEDVESAIIGGDTSGSGNVIAYNGGSGMMVAGSANRIAHNRVGVGADGVTRLGNQRHGALILGDGNIIGPSNIFAANQLSGLLLEGDNTFIHENAIQHNARSGMCVKGNGSTIISNTVQLNEAIESPWDGFDAQRDDCVIVGGIVLSGTIQTLIRGNTISDNAAPGITIAGGSRNRLSRNSITANLDRGVLLQNGANENTVAPTIQMVSRTDVQGIACPGCQVEVFADPGNQGREFLGVVQTSSDNGEFSLPITGSTLATLHITAISTDSRGNSSAFAEWVVVPSSPPIYTLHLPLLIPLSLHF